MPPITNDDNPFQRPSAWPRMPQAPFRIGALPRVGAPRPASSTLEPVRPIATTKPQGLAAGPAAPSLFGAGPMGGAVAQPPGRAAIPQSAQEPQSASVPPQPAIIGPAAAPAAAPVVTANDETFEAPPVPASATPFAVARRRKPRVTRAPLIAAGVVAAAGVAGLAVLLGGRSPEPSPQAVQAAAPQPASVAKAATTPPTTPLTPSLQAAAPSSSPGARPVRLAATVRRAETRPAPLASPASDVSAVPPAAALATAPPPVALPPIPAVETAPPPVPAVAPKPLPADPAAPISTKPTYSE